MNPQSLIYPAVTLTAFSVFFGAMEMPMASLGAAFLGFVSTLFLLASLRRSRKGISAATGPKPSAEGAEIKALQESLKNAESELAGLRTKNASYAAALEAKEKAETTRAAASSDEQAVVQFVRNLQERGRFLDFLMADIHALPDAQVGAVARVVHSGLRSLVDDYFAVEAIASAEEGAEVAIPKDQLGLSYRLLQSSSETAPGSGTLVHKGWQAKTIKLPKSQRVESAEERRILAFAEVDVKNAPGGQG